MTDKKPETTKIDPYLLERVKKVLKVGENKIKYANSKQFINTAVLSLLKEEEGVKK